MQHRLPTEEDQTIYNIRHHRGNQSHEDHIAGTLTDDPKGYEGIPQKEFRGAAHEDMTREQFYGTGECDHIRRKTESEMDDRCYEKQYGAERLNRKQSL